MAPPQSSVSTRPPPSDPSAPFEADWELLREAFRTLLHRKREILMGYHLTLSEFSALTTLSGKPHTASELAETVGITPAATTELLDRLEGRGLLQRKPHPRDRRAILVRTTAAGQRIIRDSRTAQSSPVVQAFSSMKAADRLALRRGVKALLAALGSPEA